MPSDPRARSARPTPAGLSARLRSALGPRVVVGQGPTAGARLAVSVVAGTRVDASRWARQARLPSVIVELDGDTVYVGPLAEPGRPCCGECARVRRIAAAAATDHDEPTTRVDAEVIDGETTAWVGTSGLLGPDGEATTRVDGALIDATTRVSAALIAGVDDPTAVVAHEVIDDPVVALLRDPDQLRGHVAEVRAGKVLWHRVIPLPDCAVCGGADGIGTVSLPDTDDPAELVEALAGWVDPLTGVIPWLTVRQPLPGGPYVATAAPPHRVDEDGHPHPLPIGWGKGMDEATAIRSAVGEAIERYAASLPDPARLRWARPADLDGDVLDPRDLPLYEPQQYARTAFVPFDHRVDHPWVRGTWLDDGRPVWVPAVLAYLRLALLPEHLICQGTSNGLAAGPDAESAAVSAVLELVERDAMLAAWLTGARGRFIDLDDTLDADLADAVDALTDEGHTVEVHLLPTSTYGATAAALALGDGKRLPGIAIGLGSARDPREAVRQAILELAQSAPHLTMLLRERAHPVPARPEDVRGMLDHAAYYFRPDRVVAFDRLRCGGTTRLGDLPETGAPASADDLAGVLGATGIRVALVDVTSADVATGPFRVVRAVSAGLQPLSYGFGNDRVAVPRLRPRLLPAHRRPVHPIW
ncbi:YcaO-like family protein [Actinokineospora sp. UTMC 2448]|uniref:YcaO-like family protein n=1 Tax=Actinokineospora sp. UTMC 2448 TaxID=2268449 RepID=UPI002164DE61|nr:YcaO-like family protein [Actinokineospora sp. UTMC 2448]UVS80176.1 bacteriocin biosynthesis docking scaffold, SagD family [Actinokineospora sp. UTMC 2448]